MDNYNDNKSSSEESDNDMFIEEIKCCDNDDDILDLVESLCSSHINDKGYRY